MGMNSEEIVAISELAKLALMLYMSYMKQAGMTQEQIESVYNEAKNQMFLKNPANIPGA